MDRFFRGIPLLLALPTGLLAAAPSAETARAWIRAREGGTRADRLEARQETPAGRGGRIVQFQERAAGLPVFDSDCRLLVAPDGTVTCLEDAAVPMTGKTALPKFRRPESDVLARALAAAGVANPGTIRPVSNPDGAGRRRAWRAQGAGEIRLEAGWRAEKDGLLATWDAQVPAADGTHHWHLRIDDATGRVLSAVDWALDCRIRASLPPGTSVADPSPTLLECPVDDEASPMGWNDLDGLPGADDTTTRGVNVQAQEDVDGNDAGGFRPDGGAALEFDFPFFADQPPALNRDFAITQAFALHNRLHDVFYHQGFGPADGNYQQVNYGRGGLEGDPVLVDVLDGAGSNNAITISPPDGQSGRLNYYVFTRDHQVEVVSPAGIGPLAASGATFGTALPPGGLNGLLVLALDAADAQGPSTNDVCSAILNPAAVAGRIALVDRGTCTFLTKVLNAQAAGAVAVIVVNNASNGTQPMTGADPSLHIPAVMVGLSDGNRLKSALSTGAVEVVLSGGPLVDGSLDHTLAIHEHTHLLTQRLTGGPANADVLTQAQGAGMSEGWSDWYALVLTARASDTPVQPRTIGSYAMGTAAGFRSVPYSTDPGVNSLTYASIRTLSRRHDLGEIWCSVLWEFYWEMVGQFGYSPDFIHGRAGNQRALRIVTEALKLQPSQPTYLQGRDAILLADQLLYDGENACFIWKAFARRGMGLDANDAGSSSSVLVTNGFKVPPTCDAPATEIGLLSPSTPFMRLEWNSITGAVYRVQGALSPEGPWSPLGQPVTSSVSRTSMLVAPTNALQHLRVRLESVP